LGLSTKEIKLIYTKDLQPYNILSIVSTLFISKLDKSQYINDSSFLNIEFILLTDFVLNFDKFIDINDKQLANK